MSPLVWLDCETTGVDPYTDRIVELALYDGDATIVERFNPGVPIPAEATAVHGITDDDVAGCGPFAAAAPIIQAWLGDPSVVFAGYNSASFDVCIVDAELRRAGEPGLDLSVKRDVDILRVWQALEPRSLEGAIRRFLGRDHDDAHTAEADILATAAVFDAMVDAFGIDVDEAMRLTFDETAVDRDGKFRIEDERVVFAFGKYEGRRVLAEPDYLRWMLTKDFSPEVKDICRRAIAHAGRSERSGA